MSYGISKRDNAYAQRIADIEASKTVFMAIAYSFALRLTDDNAEEAYRLVLAEWGTLHDNGIVPQQPRVWKPKRRI